RGRHDAGLDRQLVLRREIVQRLDLPVRRECTDQIDEVLVLYPARCRRPHEPGNRRRILDLFERRDKPPPRTGIARRTELAIDRRGTGGTAPRERCRCRERTVFAVADEVREQRLTTAGAFALSPDL